MFCGLYLNENKGDINMSSSLFIDDCVNNLNESNAKYKIMFKEYNDNREREWQKGWNGLVMYNWDYTNGVRGKRADELLNNIGKR